MIIEGTFVVDAARETIWPHVAEPPSLVPLLPGCEKIEATSDGSYAVSAQAKVGPIRSKLAGTLKIVEQVPPELMAFRVEGKDAATGSQVRANVKLSFAGQAAGATEVRYSADVLISGRLGGLGHGIVRETVATMLEEFVRRLNAIVKGEAIQERGLGALSVKAASRAVRSGIASILTRKEDA